MRQPKTLLLILFVGLFCFNANSLAAPAAPRAYFTKFSMAFSNTSFTNVAQLRLPAGTYLIHAETNAQAQGSTAGNLNFGCALFHTDSAKLSNLLDANQHATIFAPLNGPTLSASGYTAETATFTTSTADVIFWLCQDTSGIAMSAAGTLRAIRFQSIVTQ